MGLRKRKFAILQQEIMKPFPPQFWNDNQKNRTLRLSCNKSDYTMAYVDFLDFEINKETWAGLKLP